VVVVCIGVGISCWKGFISTTKYISQPKIMEETLMPLQGKIFYFGVKV